MSKKIGKTQKKIAAAAAQKNRDAAAIREVSSKPNSYYEAKTVPSKNTVTFKGMTIDIADKFSRTYRHDLQFPMDDFYAEINHKFGKLRIHWMPFDAPVSRKAMRDYICSKGIINYSNRDGHNITAEFSPSDLVGTIYACVDNVYSVGYVVRKPNNTSSVFQLVTSSFKSVYGTKRADEIGYLLSEVETITYTIQTFVSLYLNGDTIPDLGIETQKMTTEGDRSDPDRSKTHRSSEPKAPDADNCTAYIHYNAGADHLIIGGARQYSLKWWIVSGHDRHLRNGNIVPVQPYIKGDKDDPDAIEALKLFVEAQKRIRCFKLVRR